jgi:RND family efflux transporter MFP subunit
MKRRVLSISLLVLLGCHRGSESSSAPRATVVRTTTIRRVSDHTLERRGEVAATARLHLGFRASGLVRGVYVREGDAVQKGQLLALLDDTKARASLRESEAGATDARSESDSARALVASGSIARRASDHAATDLDRALARQALAQQSVADTRLYSPIAGRVLTRHVEPGEVVEPGATLFVVDDSSRLSVRLGLSQRDVPRVRVKQDVTLSLLGENGSRLLSGYVASLTPAPNPEDSLYTVEVRPKDDVWANLRPGAQVAVRFVDATPPSVIRVPLDSVVRRRDKDIVFVVADEPGGTTVRSRAVTVGWSEGAEVVLESGVQEGDQVVAEGAYFLEDGDRVSLAGSGDA